MRQATATTPAIRTPDRRLLLTAILIAVLAGSFWTGSRYPDLNRKAAVGGDMGVTGLAFDVVARASSQDPWWTRVGATTVNWIETNKKGMTFGLLMAAAILTLLTRLARRSVSHPLANSVVGVAIGAPLGLCVNCATPIATAMHRGGTRLEMSLAALVSSPTLNVIILTMLLSLFPWYIWATKIAATVALAVFGIPFLCRLFFRREIAEQAAVAAASRVPARFQPSADAIEMSTPEAPGWAAAAAWTIRTFAVHLWWLLRTAVPLMLLAGLLGSLVITLAPWDTLEKFALIRGGRFATLGTMGVLAIVATFLPVPMAFDVIICAILFERGLPAHHTMVLLFTLGSYSVYPFLMLRKAISLRVAAVLFIATFAVGITSGVAVRYLEKWHIARQEQVIARTLLAEPAAPSPQPPKPPAPLEDDRVAAMLGSPVQPAFFHASGDGVIRIERHPFQSSVAAGVTLFSRQDGWKLGLDVPGFFSPRKLLLRSAETNRPIASGDVHGDGWPDLLIGADHDLGGLLLFANASGKGFVRQRVHLGVLDTAMVQTAALVDLDGDGWLDIFFTTFAEGNYGVLNRQGRFPDLPVAISKDDGTLANAAAFGDIDRDRRLDIVIGNWTMGHNVARGTPKASADRVLMSRGHMRYTASGLDGSPGYTLSTLLTDFDGDGRLDLIVGNDFEPDNFYVGRGDGGFRRLLRSDGMFPGTGLNTMSVTAADVDNDLRQEIFIAQIAIGTNRRAMLARRIAPADALARIDRPQDREGLERAVKWWPVIRRLRSAEDISAVTRIDDPWMRQQFACFGAVLIAMRRVSSEWAGLLPERCGASEYLKRSFSERYAPDADERARRIPVADTRGENLLLKSDGRHGFVDRTSALNLGITDWTWNARFADVDNDGWQDLYAANGWARQDGWESNVFLRNVNGTTYRNDTTTAGLADHLPTSGYTYVDVDLDGDLDIVSVPVLGPVRVFSNNSRGTRAIQFELRDQAGNTQGIGSTIAIHYGKNGELHQMREIQAGGGFVSYDAAVAHFGLGAHDSVDRVEVRWSTGETTTIARRFEAGHRYIVHRQAAQSRERAP